MREVDKQLFDSLCDVLKKKDSMYEIGIFNNWLTKFFDEDKLVEFFDEHFNDDMLQDNGFFALTYEEEGIVIEIKSVSDLLKINLYDHDRYNIINLNN